MSANEDKTAQAEQQPEATYTNTEETEATIEAAPADDLSSESDPAGEGNEWEQQLEELRKQADENQQRYLRAQADFENFRRRSRLEKEEFAKYASLKIVEQILPVVDNFERALSSARDTQDFEALAKGVDMIYRQLEQVLVEEGLQPMNTIGQPFNPEYHQAIMQVESDEHEEGIVVEELQKGYMLKDKVIRPAMVKVSS